MDQWRQVLQSNKESLLSPYLYRSQTHLVAVAVRFLRASSTPALATQRPAALCQGAVRELGATVAFLWAPEHG